MTTYREYLNGDTNIKFGQMNEKWLVLGWLIYDIDGNEVRYALHVAGRTARSDPAPANNVWFNKPEIRWNYYWKIPDDAEFIGQYVDDIFGP